MLERTRINSTPATTNQEAMAASDTRGQHEYKGKGVASLPVTAPGLQSLQSLQKPKSAASKIRTKYLGDLSIPLEPRLTDIGLAAARPAESGSELLPYEVPLAAYLTAQSALNNPADTITAQRLSWANKAMAEARNLLPLGRSNVQDDHLASAGESNKRTQAQATLLDKIGSSLNPPSSATALWAGTGNAYQHMMLTAQSLMSRPAVVEQEHFNAIWSNEKTHAWLVSAPSQQPEDISHQTIYMDAFNDGPPMLVKHSAHNHGQVNLYSLQVTQHTVNHELAREKYNAQQLAVMLSPSQLSTGQEPHETTVRAQSGVLPMFAETAAIKMKRELSPQQASALAKISNPIKNQNETLEIILSFDKKIAQIRKKVKNKSLKNKDIHTAHTTI